MTSTAGRTTLRDQIIGPVRASTTTPPVLGAHPEVLAELPVTDSVGLAWTLVATPGGLIVSRDGSVPENSRMAGDYVHWDAVRLAATEGAGDAWFGLRVNVGARAFHAWLQGEPGRRTLRDFVVLVQAHRDGAESPEATSPAGH